MANITSATKRNKQSDVRNARNRAVKSNILTASKRVSTAIEGGNKDDAVKEFSVYTSQLDKACKKGVIKKNTAGRKKSRISASIAKMA